MAKILAVDDEPAILEMIESILNKDGHLVTKVSNPLKINMEELHRYDLILLDIMMPGIDGFELCKRIRALVDWSDFVSYGKNGGKQSGKRTFFRSR